jgi:hypothetical protein
MDDYFEGMRLMTYNIHKGIGGRDRRYDLRRVIDVIEAENPDIICLQEVDHNVHRSRYHDQARMLVDYFKVSASINGTSLRETAATAICSCRGGISRRSTRFRYGWGIGGRAAPRSSLSTRPRGNCIWSIGIWVWPSANGIGKSNT